MLNFKNEYFTLEKGRLKYPTQFKDKSFLVVYGSKEGGITGTELTAHIYKIPENYYEINAGQLDFSNYPNGIENDFLTIRVTNLDSLFSLPLNFTDWKDISPENLTTTFEKIGTSILDIQKRLSEVAVYIDSGKPDQINLPKLPVGCTWYKDQDENIVALPISDLYGKFQQMIDSLHKTIKDLLDIDYTKLSDNLKKELTKHLLTLEEALGKHKDSLDKYTLEKIEEIKATCDRIIGLALSKLTKADTIEDLKTMRFLKVGDIVEVLGYYTAGDGANHKRIVANEDDGSGVQLTNGLWANRIKKNATVVFTFDDNKILDNEVYELFKNKGLTCTFGAITNLLFHNNSNTLENLYKYTKDGFEIISHGGKHIANLTDVNLAKYEYEESRIALNKLGFDARGFIAPYSEVKDEVLQICENAYDYILIGGDGIHYPHKFPKNKKLTRVHLNTKTLDEKKALIKRAMQEDLLIIFYAHQTDKGDDFVEFINWISQQPIKIKNASDGVFDFYPELKDTGYVLTDNSGFADLSIERNNNSLSNKLNNKQYYVYDHNSIGVTIKDKTIKIPACQKSSTISIQAYFDLISWWSTYKILTSVKFSNVLSNKFKVTQEVILFKNSEEKLVYPAQLIESSADKFSNNVFYTTNNQTANKLKLVIRIVALEQTTSTTDFEVDSIKVFDLSKSNTILPKPDIPEPKPQFSCKNIESMLDDAQTFNKNGLSVVVPSLKKDMGIIVVNPATDLNSWSYQFGFDNDKKAMTYRHYNTITSSWSEWIPLGQAQNVMKKLDTPHYARLMQKEGCLDDFDAYLIEKNIYDKEQIKLEEQRQLAYEQALQENPNLTYEEFTSVQPMTLNLLEEPQPSEALKRFMEKYL